MSPGERRWLLLLTVAALLSRLAWALWLHPPRDHVFHDMRAYLVHARWLVEHGLEPWQAMAFQPPGTSILLAGPLAIFGVESLTIAALLWALLAAAQIPLVYLLTREIGSRPWMAPAVGVATLLWIPGLSYAGLFTSEAPYATALL
ncbi:MAG: hypothetical protein KC431_17965, partial [Myxococcales bacterium]|nr:hypothetical protein [Myxococcales bacterium]